MNSRGFLPQNVFPCGDVAMRFGKGIALGRALSEGRQRLTNWLFISVCWLISVLLPKSRWYSAALSISLFLARGTGWVKPAGNNVSDASLAPRILHRFLDILSMRSRYFPIPVVVEGEDYLRDYAAQSGGFVICSAHIPFVKLIFPLVRQVIGDQRPARVSARDPEGGNEVAAWTDGNWEAIRTDHAVLLHTRSLLRQNGCLMLAVDKERGEFISSNIFRFVGKMHSRILMFFTQLRPDGKILLRIMLPPGPGCRSEDEIRANLDFVAENVRRILQGDKIQVASRLGSTQETQLAGERSREIHRIQLYSTTQLEARMKRLEALLTERDHVLSQRELLQDRLKLMQLEREARAGV